MLDNYGAKPTAFLPTLNVSGVKNPVVQIVDEVNDEIVYTLRSAGQSWRPHVFAPGEYSVRVSEPETGRERSWRESPPAPTPRERLTCVWSSFPQGAPALCGATVLITRSAART